MVMPPFGILAGLPQGLQQGQQQQIQQQELMMRLATLKMQAQLQQQQMQDKLKESQAMGGFFKALGSSQGGPAPAPLAPPPSPSPALASGTSPIPSSPNPAAASYTPAADTGGMSTGGAPDKFLDLAKQDESGGGKNVPNYRYDPTHTAQGYWQITDTNWRKYAPPVGVSLVQYPTAMAAPESIQRKVAEAVRADQGEGAWTNFNPKLAKDWAAAKGDSTPANEIYDALGGDKTAAAAQPIVNRVVNTTPPALFQQINYQDLAKRIEATMPGAPDDVKGMALVHLAQFLSPVQKQQVDMLWKGLEYGQRERETDARLAETKDWHRTLASQKEQGANLQERKFEATQASPMSDADIEFWANILRNGGSLPPGLSRTSAGTVQKIMAKIPGMEGRDPGSFIANTSAVKADAGSLRNMTKMADAATSFEQTASRNFDLALKLSKDAVPTDWGPWLNRWIMSGETQFGNESVPPYVTAMLTGANEYAKIMSGATGAQGSTVDSRREAAELFSPYLSKGQISRVVAIAKADMANRKQSLYGQIDAIKGRLRGAGSKEPTATQGQPASAAPPAEAPTATGPNGAKMKWDGTAWVPTQ